jgi:hypothetical protein
MGTPERARSPVTGTTRRYGSWVGVLGALIVVFITVNALLTTPNGVRGIAPGRRMPPFAVPLAAGRLSGDANVATAAGQGAAGREPACSVRGAGVLNICQQWEQGPVVLALFVNSGSCPQVVDEMQRLAAARPGVRFAAVAIRGGRAALRRALVRRHWTLPVGYDRDGVLANLYHDASCPQVSFALPGGTVAFPAELAQPSPAALAAAVDRLQRAARERGWSG